MHRHGIHLPVLSAVGCVDPPVAVTALGNLGQEPHGDLRRPALRRRERVEQERALVGGLARASHTPGLQRWLAIVPVYQGFVAELMVRDPGRSVVEAFEPGGTVYWIG